MSLKVIPCGLSLHTHMHCMSWVVYLNFLCLGKYLCWLYSQLSFISLPSFEMLSDYVISRLYMRVLKLTWEKLISVKFSLVFLMFQCGASRQSLLGSGRVELIHPDGSGYVRTRVAINGRTVSITRSDARDLSAWFRGSARPYDIISPSGQGPHRPYKYLVAALSL
jgi:hypothetical protein